MPCFLMLSGFLNTAFLSDEECDIFGYSSVAKLRIIIILRQKPNLEVYNETKIHKVFLAIHELYLQDVFNPFRNVNIDKLSSSFEFKLDRLVDTLKNLSLIHI
eukprot:TRINITY_DN7901_c0_g1_i1.p1 TRINITY_DN7901_c0_g1~~TRINITY_DN7901_c0_g1_i1.p1  ORF type:complete len:103 (+),score=11.70 TRINITY_DN7901_c0_g1_i1:230-538(+)